MQFTEETLDADDIQGNVLPGFNKPHQSFNVFTISDPVACKKWLYDFADQVTSLDEVFGFKTLRKALLRRLGRVPPSVVATWRQIAFTFSGLTKISALGAETLPDPSFQAGLAAASQSLGDWGKPTDPGHPSKWVVGSPGQDVDLLIIIASDDATALAAETTALESASSQFGLSRLWSEQGHKLESGQEHFGFEDGVSQPGVRGMLSSRPGVYLTPRTIDPSDPSVSNPDGPEYSAPGQPLIWPGQFVFGYARQNPNDYRQPSEQPPPATPPWARNGSFLVFRRLQQQVGGFRFFLSSQLPTLQNSGFDGLTAEAFGALLVGRWQSGVPLLRSPRSDPGSSVGLDPETNNAFIFINPFPQMKLANGHTVGAAPGDPFGVLCPFSAHIRKVNPRDSPTDFNNSSDTLTRRILRRGIPYGVEYSDPDPENGNRGLLFVSFQTSISQQFEFLQTQWADSPVRPLGRTGNDMIIGQSLDPTTRTRSISLSSRPGNAVTISSLNDFVIPTGGGYFFAPSRSAIKSFGSPSG